MNMTPTSDHIMKVVKHYPTGALLLMCPQCGLTMVKDPVSGAVVALEYGPNGCIPVNHYFYIVHAKPPTEPTDELDVWRKALEDIQL